MKNILIATMLLVLISCSSNGKYEAPKAENREPMTGKKVFETYCVACHGADGKMGFSGAKDLSVTQLSHEDRIKVITYGKGVMNPFKDVLSPDEIQKVAFYIDSLAIK